MNTIKAHIALVFAASLLGGCGGPSKVDYARPFPTGLTQLRTVNVQVLRMETEITLTNTSAQEFPPCTMWINRQFSRPIDGLGIGRSVTLPLESFRNEYSEPFRAGGFFATERPDRIAQVQLETEDGFVGLIVVGDR